MCVRLIRHMKITYILIILIFLSSCAASPKKVDITQDNDQYMDCPQIYYSLQEAEQLKTDARKDDRFQFRYMMPMTAMMSIYNINKAEGNAEKRIEHLKQLAGQRGCRY